MDSEISPNPNFPETPWEAVGPVVREKVTVAGRNFIIARPSESDRMLEHPAVRSTFLAHDYLPYWADLWPASRMLAKAVLHEAWRPGQEALEVGCGLGLPGIAALAAGLRVTFSDYDRTALRFAADNARLNGFADFRTLRLDWESPPPELRFPVVLASDLLYELRNVAPLVGLLRQVLAPGGLCLMTDQDRVPSHELRRTLVHEGFVFDPQPGKVGEPGGHRVRGTLYRITRPY